MIQLMTTTMFPTVFIMCHYCKTREKGIYIYLLIYAKTIPEMDHKQLMLSAVCGKDDRMAGIQGLQRGVYYRHISTS